MTAPRDMAEVRRRAAAAGSHWFEPATLRFFRSRVGRTLFGGRYFVSSEQFSPTSERRYTVREVTPDGHVRTIGKFMGYGTSRAAQRAIAALLGGAT